MNKLTELIQENYQSAMSLTDEHGGRYCSFSADQVFQVAQLFGVPCPDMRALADEALLVGGHLYYQLQVMADVLKEHGADEIIDEIVRRMHALADEQQAADTARDPITDDSIAAILAQIEDLPTFDGPSH